jgi:lantibiotic modifying enzyme
LALLELGRVTGEARYRDAGIRAFDYESSLFDTRHCNWPDLRAPRSTLGYAPPVDSSFTTFWCHGAPGMLTARLRVVDLLPERLVDETAAAVRSTAAAVRAMLDAHDNFSLCHGLAGNAEALLLAIARDRVSASTTATIAGLPALVAETGIERYVERGVDWPSGARRGRNPSLFLGAAGPGHLLLSLARPDTATALFPVIPGRRS